MVNNFGYVNKPEKPSATFAVAAWMLANTVFMALELAVFNDATDLNNSILLILWMTSIIGMISMRKIGATITLFTLIYVFSFNAFNAIYYSEVIVLNGASVTINAVVTVYMFSIIFQDKFK